MVNLPTKFALKSRQSPVTSPTRTVYQLRPTQSFANPVPYWALSIKQSCEVSLYKTDTFVGQVKHLASRAPWSANFALSEAKIHLFDILETNKPTNENALTEVLKDPVGWKIYSLYSYTSNVEALALVDNMHTRNSALCDVREHPYQKKTLQREAFSAPSKPRILGLRRLRHVESLETSNIIIYHNKTVGKSETT